MDSGLTREQLRVTYPSVYKWLLRNNRDLLNNKLPLRVSKRTFLECLQDSRKYDTISEWSKGLGTTYSTARKNGWVKKCSQHMCGRFAWTIDLIQKDAVQCRSVSEWRRKFPNSYSAAKRKNLVKCVSQHMKRPLSDKRKSVVRSDGKVYKSITDARKDGYLGISQVIARGGKCGGYHWAYCDENGNVLNE